MHRSSRNVLLALPALAVAGYLALCAWFWVHQREFQYTPGGARVSPEAAGVGNFGAIHGTADENVPIAEARRLYAAARPPKTMIEIAGAGHLPGWGEATPAAVEALQRWTR